MSNELVDQLVRAGAPQQVVDAARARIKAAPVDPNCYVWPENWTALQLFLKLSTQWEIVVGMAGAVYTGLKYESVETQMSRLRISLEERPEYWDYLEVMERAALPLLNKSKK